MTSPENNATSTQKKSVSRFATKPIVLILTVIVSVIFLPTLVLLIGGMMPSIVAYTLDDTQRKSKTKAVAYLNLAGCFIVGMELWTGENSIDSALDVLLTPVNWVIMYGMALLGWILIKSLQPFIVSYLKVNYQMQQKNLRKRRKSLLKEWGEAVAAVSTKGDFIYDNKVYLDDDDILNDPDEDIDKIPEEKTPLQITDESQKPDIK